MSRPDGSIGAVVFWSGFFGTCFERRPCSKWCSRHSGSTILVKSPLLAKCRKGALPGPILRANIDQNRGSECVLCLTLIYSDRFENIGEAFARPSASFWTFWGYQGLAFPRPACSSCLQPRGKLPTRCFVIGNAALVQSFHAQKLEAPTRTRL